MPRCRVADCNIKYALYNLPGESPGICCAKHKEDGMIDVKHKKCLYENCNIRPNYNYKDEIKAIYCKIHKLDDMINIISKTCIYESCRKQPNYNYENEKTTIYCVKHKLDDMINIKSKLCLFEDCKTQPNFNYENEKTAIYCGKHKLENMININHKTCIYEGCIIQPVFNYENEINPLYCVKHKLKNMVDILNKTCIYDGCKTQPIYNYDDQKEGLYCFLHKLENMINIKDINKKCNFNNCQTLANTKYKGYCLRDFMYLFPDEPVARNYKIKEKHVSDYIKLYFKEYVESYDKQIQGGCSKKRPDIFIDLFTHSIIIEIDENQHFDYSCENKRMMQIFEDLANRPIVFIRFNPDKYIDENREIVNSCFKYHKTSGVPMIDDKEKWNKRLETLKNIIGKYVSNIPEKEVTIEHLFYNKNL